MELEAYNELPENELVDRINKARREKNAVILAHNYQILEVQHIADYRGDSLELSRLAAKTDADLVVFCGVNFMAESAKILAPEKKVLLPEIKATCPMAHMVTPEALKEAKTANPDRVVLAYVNTTAATKALTDICCTSANAVNVVNSLLSRLVCHDTAGEKKEILFVPDKNLSHYTRKETGAKIIPWDGYCYVHNYFTVDDVNRARAAHPGAVLLVHPESPPEVVEMADYVFSTSGMVRYVANMENEEEKQRGVIIGTEIGLAHQLRETYPDIGIWPLNEFAICGTMKMTTLPKVCWSIETENFEVILPEDMLKKARTPLEKMLKIV